VFLSPSSRCPQHFVPYRRLQRSGRKGRGAAPYLRPRATGPASPAVGVAAPHGRDGVSGGDAEPYRLFCTVAASRQRWQPAGLNSFELLRSRSADSVGRPPNFLPFQRRMDGWMKAARKPLHSEAVLFLEKKNSSRLAIPALRLTVK